MADGGSRPAIGGNKGSCTALHSV